MTNNYKYDYFMLRLSKKSYNNIYKKKDTHNIHMVSLKEKYFMTVWSENKMFSTPKLKQILNLINTLDLALNEEYKLIFDNNEIIVTISN